MITAFSLVRVLLRHGRDASLAELLDKRIRMFVEICSKCKGQEEDILVTGSNTSERSSFQVLEALLHPPCDVMVERLIHFP